jgi:hypothetical protein
MPWARFSDTFPEDPRWESVSVEAFAVHAAGVCHCAKLLTDGFVSLKAARRLPLVEDTVPAIQELITAGFWRESPDGYEIVDYLANHGRPAEAVLAERAASARRQATWRENKRAGRNAVTNAVTNGTSNGCPAPPLPAPKGRGGKEGAGASGPAPLTLRGPSAPLPEIVLPPITIAGGES